MPFTLIKTRYEVLLAMTSFRHDILTMVSRAAGFATPEFAMLFKTL